jgi:hypothetical protein
LLKIQNKKITGMKFNIGDKVRFLNDVGGGKVVKFIDKNTVLVLNDDDFEIPYPESELIPDRDLNYKVEEEQKGKTIPSIGKNIPEKKPEQEYRKENESLALYLAIVPDILKDIARTSHKAYLINDSNFECFANVLFKYGALYVSKPVKISANAKAEIKALALSDFNDIDAIQVQAVFFQLKPHALKPMVTKELKIQASRFFKQNTYTTNDFFEENAFVYCIIDEDKQAAEMPEIHAEEIEQAIKTKEIDSPKMNSNTESKSSKSLEIREIDLHIHELMDDFSAMSAKEILDYQMDSFREEMKKAIAEKVRKIVFIHGKGDGILKTELRKELKTNYRRYSFQDASFQQYGFGATMVILVG